MTMNSEGIVFFGYYFDEGDFPDGDRPDIDDIAAARAQAKGAVPVDWSSCPLGYGVERDAWYEIHLAEIDAWFASRDKELQVFKDVYWGLAGSYSCGVDYVCINYSRKDAAWGEMVDISSLNDEVMEDWVDILNNHLTAIGVPIPKEEPAWYLTSMYG